MSYKKNWMYFIYTLSQEVKTDVKFSLHSHEVKISFAVWGSPTGQPEAYYYQEARAWAEPAVQLQTHLDS